MKKFYYMGYTINAPIIGEVIFSFATTKFQPQSFLDVELVKKLLTFYEIPFYSTCPLPVPSLNKKKPTNYWIVIDGIHFEKAKKYIFNENIIC